MAVGSGARRSRRKRTGFARIDRGRRSSPDRNAELKELVVDHCAALRRNGLRPPDVAALQASNSIAFIVALLGAARAGIVVAPLDAALPVAERRMRADRIGALAVVTDTKRPSVDAWIQTSISVWA
jgi:acyl-CoA synthetase (AMP-forming)/AMP-acid ligase II